ncbi:MAG: thioredoxin-like domain-containing protein [Bacteroidota bacterium]
MTRFFFIFLLGISFIVQGQGHRIDFKVIGLADSAITLGYHMGSQKYALDTLSVKNQSFYVEGSEPLKPGLYFVYSPGFYLEFIVKEQQFSIQAVSGKGYEDFKVKGSKENELFREFQLKMIELRTLQQSYQAKIKEGLDSAEMVMKLKEVESSISNYRDQIAKENPESFLAAFLNLMKEPDVPDFPEVNDPQSKKLNQYRYYRAHYFDFVQLDNPALIRTPLLEPKVMKYFDQVIMQHPDTINQELDRLFDEVGDNTELFRYWLISFYNKYQESKIMGMDKVVVHLMEDYFLSGKADWVNEDGIEKIKEEVAFKKYSLIGNIAPELVLVDTLNQPFYFEQITDPYILLYFYDPDCGHCKKKTPILVNAYDQFRDLGVEVVAICTVTDVARWKEYIRETNMEFINLADPGYESNFRVHYDLRSTPKMYLLDQQRRIIAKQLEIEDLLQFVKRHAQ